MRKDRNYEAIADEERKYAAPPRKHHRLVIDNVDDATV